MDLSKAPIEEIVSLVIDGKLELVEIPTNRRSIVKAKVKTLLKLKLDNAKADALKLIKEAKKEIKTALKKGKKNAK